MDDVLDELITLLKSAMKLFVEENPNQIGYITLQENPDGSSKLIIDTEKPTNEEDIIYVLTPPDATTDTTDD